MVLKLKGSQFVSWRYYWRWIKIWRTYSLYLQQTY